MRGRLIDGSSFCKTLRILFIMALVAGVSIVPATASWAQEPPPRPSPVAPLPGPDTVEGGVVSQQQDAAPMTDALATTVAPSGWCAAFQAGADRLVALQNDDGGWDWPLDDGNPSSTSPLNTVGPIAMGLAQAYLHTGDSDHLAALQKASDLLLGKTNNFSPSDGYLAAKLDSVFGGTTYVDHVTVNYYGPLAAGTYDRNGVGTLYDTAGYVNLIRTSRASQGISNLAAWDIGMGLVGAASAGADTGPWIAGVKAEIDELDGNAYYDVIGLAGAVYALAFVGEDFDPTAGEHASASGLGDLAAILAGYQIGGGGFSWNKNFLNPGEDNETIQETTYAILALNEFDASTYADSVQGAMDYLLSVQLATGGWRNWAGAGENNEVTGEALWGVGVAAAAGTVTSDVTADPNPASVLETVLLTAMVDHIPTGCSFIASAEYSLNGVNWTSMVAADGSFDSMVESVESTFSAPATTGIYDLCVRGIDSAGNTGPEECIMFVVYDPSGGFVTGGGWIDSPAGAVAPVPALVWDQGFEADIAGWYDSTSEWYGLVTRVPSGTNGVASAAGGYHAVFEGDASSGPFTRFDAYRDTWPGAWTAEIDVYLDPAWEAGTGFDYTVAASGSDGAHQRDYIFHVTKDSSTGQLLVAGSNNTNFAPREDLENINHYAVTTASWYTLQHLFYESGGALAVDLNLLDKVGNLLFTETRFNAADLIPDEVGGNRYGWFTFINVDNGIAVDEHQLVIPVGATGKATFGFVSKYSKKTELPEGSTEFQFKAADLNFRSTSYDWLVVNQAGSNAQFKGVGTINGEGTYKFMLWAGDGEPDTFRIKIWYEDGDGEHIVYDNGVDQPIAGGNIVVHKAK